MSEEALKQILNQHFHSVALWVVVINAFAILANSIIGTVIGYSLNRRFRKLEVGLKALEAKDKAKIDYLHPKKADAANIILSQARSLSAVLTSYVMRVQLCKNNPTQERRETMLQRESLAEQALIELSGTHIEYRPLLTNDFNNALDVFMNKADAVILVSPEDDCIEPWGIVGDSLNKLVKEVEASYRRLLGSDE